MLRSEAAAGDVTGHAKADYLMGRQSPGPEASFLAAAEEDRLQMRPRLAADVERSNPLGAVELVRRQRHEIERQRVHIQWDLADRLRGITVEEDAARTAKRADRGDILDDADLVIDEHDRGQHRVRTQ